MNTNGPDRSGMTGSSTTTTSTSWVGEHRPEAILATRDTTRFAVRPPTAPTFFRPPAVTGAPEGPPGGYPSVGSGQFPAVYTTSAGNIPSFSSNVFPAHTPQHVAIPHYGHVYPSFSGTFPGSALLSSYPGLTYSQVLANLGNQHHVDQLPRPPYLPSSHIPHHQFPSGITPTNSPGPSGLPRPYTPGQPVTPPQPVAPGHLSSEPHHRKSPKLESKDTPARQPLLAGSPKEPKTVAGRPSTSGLKGPATPDTHRHGPLSETSRKQRLSRGGPEHAHSEGYLDVKPAGKADESSAKRPKMGLAGLPPPLQPVHTTGLPQTSSASSASYGQILPPPPPLQPDLYPTPHYPPHFMKGSIIQLASGELKRVEDLRTDDFVNSAEISPDLKIDSSTVVRVEENHERGTAILGFSVGEHKIQVTVEATQEHPFFVFGQGWSSCSPERTARRYGLHCQRLLVGDVCISLTQRDPSQAAMTTAEREAAADRGSGPRAGGGGAMEARARQQGIHVISQAGRGPVVMDRALRPQQSVPAPGADVPPPRRRRRWSAPDQVRPPEADPGTGGAVRGSVPPVPVVTSSGETGAEPERAGGVKPERDTPSRT